MRYSHSFRGALIPALFLLAAAEPTLGSDILFDESHGQYWSMYTDARFDTARAELLGAGHVLASLTGSPGAITPAALTGYDIFCTGTLDSSYTPSEVTALQGFVSSGGGVVVIHDGGWSSDSATPSVNDFLAPYGVVMAASPTYGSGLVVSGFVSHALTQGISDLGFDYVRELTTISSPSLDLTTGTVEMLSVYDGGGGWVIVLPDDAQWSDVGSGSDYDITSHDNLQMLHNVFGYGGQNIGVQYCPGDGISPHTPCPCANNNNGAMGGCDWGSPFFPEGGVLDATGSSSMAANDTYLVATGTENNFGIFFGANNQVNGGNGNPLNDGLRCAGGGLVRLIPPTVATGNQATTPLPVQTLDSGAASGVTRRYQYWFRTPGGPCGQMANLTNGYEIAWGS